MEMETIGNYCGRFYRSNYIDLNFIYFVFIFTTFVHTSASGANKVIIYEMAFYDICKKVW